LRLDGALINAAPFPLLGLALLQIAAELGPHDPLLKNRARLCSQLALAAPSGSCCSIPCRPSPPRRSTTNARSAWPWFLPGLAWRVSQDPAAP
jgi:hypothetical protein